MTASEPDRLRTPPRERFTGDTHLYDLEKVFQDLAGEPQSPIDGHHQITLFKSGNSTVLAFLFEEGGHMRRHQADGIATIQVLEGRLEIETPDENLSIEEGGLLVLRPGVPHEVNATAPSKMILTVHLRKPVDQVEEVEGSNGKK